MKAIEMEKSYNPKDFEERIYARWLNGGYFKPISTSDKKPFVVVIPPPNVTGILHAGHALNATLQDIIVRYQRMNGHPALWVPGTDHAGIATQHIVEKKLKAQGIRRQDLGREKFIEETWKIKAEHHAVIVKQLMKLGSSCDWSRERFTLDEGVSQAVREVFVTLYERGLLYRGNYLVNWCPSCMTALADDEVEHEDENGFMYHILYRFADGSGEIEVATTRPETLLGDVAVACHPEDERYHDLIGKHLRLPLTDRTIPLIADTYVDKEFGTGLVKITPAHDPNDFELGNRHGFERINILNTDGTLNEVVPEKYRNKKVSEARKMILADLEEQGLFLKKEQIKHSVGHCYRCHTIIEPYLSDQWFVKMKPLAEKALDAWKKGDIHFYPQRWENTYEHWLTNIRDWCISRQLWWGHRIPAWTCTVCGELIVSRNDPDICSKCGATKDSLVQDSDVLDTWFSSWLWPFSVFGWPEKTQDLANFYPTSTLVTGYDIIFFWVARMIMAGLEFLGEVPFRDIYMTTLVRDKQGRKMSKSLGNGIDPLEIVNEYGADALKFTLAFLTSQGQDVLLDKESFKLGSKFANKIWNASRYILGNLEGRTLCVILQKDLTELDRWIYHQLNEAVKKCRAAFDSYRFNEAAQTVYEFFWNDFCDWYVEGTKLSFRGIDEGEKNRAISVLLSVLEESLRLLHPFLPFITEEIYDKLPPLPQGAFSSDSPISQETHCDMIICASFPCEIATRAHEVTAKRFAVLQDVVRSVRTLRAECGISNDTKLHAALFIIPGSNAQVCHEKIDLIELLAGIDKTDFLPALDKEHMTAAKPTGAIGSVGEGYEIFIITGDSIDTQQLIVRFTKEIEAESAFAQKVQAKLNGSFALNAPAQVVSAEREKLEAVSRRLEKLKIYIEDLKSLS